MRAAKLPADSLRVQIELGVGGIGISHSCEGPGRFRGTRVTWPHTVGADLGAGLRVLGAGGGGTPPTCRATDVARDISFDF